LKVPGPIKALLPPLLSSLRVWDRHAADRVDHFLANSETVAERIEKYYDRESDVMHPPVDVSRFSLSDAPKTYFLAGGRLVPYKRFDLIVEAANKTGIPVKIFGTGPAEAALKAKAKPNVEFLGRVSAEEQARLYANAKAYLHPQEEDFGITAVESMAAGRPVIAYGKGGAAETVVPGVTGQFLTEQSWEELADHLIRFDDAAYNAAAIRAHAERFATDAFKQRLKQYVESTWQAKQKNV
jgi:glycosyltransferase involved in cell wall biosynthesis